MSQFILWTLVTMMYLTPPKSEANQLETINFQQSTALEKKSSILFVGDSLCMGMSYQFNKLARKNKYIPSNHCIGGTNTMQWVKMIDEDITLYKPKLVLVSLGTNESGFWGDWILNHPETYSTFINKIKKSKAKLVWISPPALPYQKLPQQDRVREIIKSYADIYYDSTAIEIQRASDEIHATPEGYKFWMDSVWQWMVDAQIIL